ncbi:MAG: alkaline phosphatase family protein, partial [Candidatus Binatia bacterium]
TYDEHGGFYDHVPPPLLPDGRSNSFHCEDWSQAGFRVPTILASPFSPRGVVGTNTYDHTSILKLLEWRFALLPLTARDAAANNLAEVLDFGNPDPDLPADMPFVPLHAAGAYCWQSQPPEETNGENPLEPVPDLPLPPLTPPEPVASATGAEPHAELLAIADAGHFGRLDMRERAKHGVFRT